MSTVIPFPNKSSIPTTNEELDNKIKEVQTRYVETVVEMTMDRVMSELEDYGFELDQTEDIVAKDIFFLRETMKSILLRKVGVEHFIQDMIEDSITLQEVEESAKMDEHEIEVVLEGTDETS